jgi:hypothetical protein
MYEIHFKNMHPGTSSGFEFQGNAAGATGFNEYMNTTYWYLYHGGFGYSTGGDQGTSSSAPRRAVYQSIGYAQSTADGYPSSTWSGILVTDRRHFWTTGVYARSEGSIPSMQGYYVAGSFTPYIEELDFRFSGGNIDSGQIDLYGVATS